MPPELLPRASETVVSGVAPPRRHDTSEAATLPAPVEPDADAQVPSPGTRIGRFVVLGTLGSGGMGIVVSAFDPDLDRKVALKLVRAATWAEFSSWGRDRLLREARAMARLSHPNVVTVHEVGTVDAQAFIAMEFATGGTLRAWCAAEVRPWREVLAVLIDAGRGLVAAHQAGLVHRDFKPENVLLTEGGVRVADFGLVGLSGDEVETPVSLEPVSATDPLTRTGALVGTPAYMAPEQHARDKAGPAADQFSFCVTAWETLHRVHPFATGSYPELVENVKRGVPVAPATGDVPAWVRDALLRGLRPSPADRWPSMEALLEALERDPEAVRRRRLGAVGLIAASAVVGAAAMIALARGETAAAPRCQNMASKLGGVWDGAVQARVQDAFRATGKPYADDTFHGVAARLDGYTSSWVAARTDACEATHVRGEQSEALLDLRMACLDRRLGELRALTAVLEAGGADVLDDAPGATSQLAPLAACADVDALRAIVPPPADPAQRRAVDQLRQELARAKALEDAGRYRDGLALAASLALRARDLAHAPILAEALHRRGSLEERVSQAPAAITTLEEALLQASEARDDALAARIWPDLVYAAYSAGRAGDAGRMQPAAEAALRRAGNEPLDEARLRNALGGVYAAQARYEEARPSYERALALRTRALGPDDPLVALSLDNLGKVLQDQGKYAEARRYHEQALAVWQKALGSEHPAAGSALYELGNLAMREGRYDDALGLHQRALVLREKALGPEHELIGESLAAIGTVYMQSGAYAQSRPYYQRALAMREKTLGPEHPAVASSLNDLGNALEATGDRDGAQARFERALATWEKAVGPAHPDVAVTLLNLANVANLRDDHAGARRHLERALAIYEKALGANHPDVGGALTNLGYTAADEGKLEEARQLQERALALWERAFGPDGTRLAYPLTGLAEVLVRLGRVDEGRAAAERAVKIRQARGAGTEELGRSQFALARALRDRGEAVALARKARDGYAAAGPQWAKEIGEIEAWIRRR